MLRRIFLRRAWRHIASTTRPICNDSHKPRTYASGLTLRFDVVSHDWHFRDNASEVCTSTIRFGAVLGGGRWLANLHGEIVPVALYYWLDVGLFARFGGKDEC